MSYKVQSLVFTSLSGDRLRDRWALNMCYRWEEMGLYQGPWTKLDIRTCQESRCKERWWCCRKVSYRGPRDQRPWGQRHRWRALDHSSGCGLDESRFGWNWQNPNNACEHCLNHWFSALTAETQLERHFQRSVGDFNVVVEGFCPKTDEST